MNATVDSLIRLSADDLPVKAREIIHRELTIPNPEYVNRAVFGRWLGTTPAELHLYDEHNGHVLLPRGAHTIARSAMKAAGGTVKWLDHRVTCAPLEVEALGLTLRSYQSEAAHALVHHVQGCAVLPPGAGKTVIGCAAIAKVAQPTLVIVHTKDLLEQWRERIRTVLGLEGGTIGGGAWDVGDVTVATVQTLVSADLASIAHRFGIVIVDEAHHVPAETFRSVLGKLPAKYRWGLTATPKREDGLTPLLELGIGPVVYEVGHTALVDAGHLVLPTIRQVDIDAHWGAETYADLVAELVADPGRNETICNLALEGGRRTLILSGRVQHCADLVAQLGEVTTVAALTGQVSKRHRESTLDDFRAGRIQVLCATSLADEGLDLPNLERLILATPARARGRTIQRLGRLMRPHAGKSRPELIDLVDSHPIALRQWVARRRAYRTILGASL